MKKALKSGDAVWERSGHVELGHVELGHAVNKGSQKNTKKMLKKKHKSLFARLGH